MIITRSHALTATVAVAFICHIQTAQAEQYRVVATEAATVCQSGDKSDVMTLDGPRDSSIAHADGDKLNVAVCLDPSRKGVMNVRYRANGYWYSSGNISEGCTEILGASKVKVRAVDSNFHQTAAYYSCVQER